MNALVVYYSNTGNNRYLAERISRALTCDCEAVRPRPPLFPFLVLFTLLRASPGVGRLRNRVNGRDCMIVCGPIWMGQPASPVRDIIARYHSSVPRLYFATCCGSTDAGKNNTFGYASVFSRIESMAKGTPVCCEAFPVGLVLPENERNNGDAVMKVRLSDSNFTGRLQERFDSFIRKVTGSHGT
jgi:hypothetical protein